jgi:hypothetical protein
MTRYVAVRCDRADIQSKDDWETPRNEPVAPACCNGEHLNIILTLCGVGIYRYALDVNRFNCYFPGE